MGGSGVGGQGEGWEGGDGQQAKAMKFHEGGATRMVICLPKPDNLRDWRISSESAPVGRSNSCFYL